MSAAVALKSAFFPNPPVVANDLQAERFELYARDELLSGGSSLTNWARREGIDLRPILDRNYVVSLLWVIFRGDSFEFADGSSPHARAAVVMEVFDRDDETALDLLAFDIYCPETFALMFGRAEMLGLHDAYNPASYRSNRPIRLHRIPLGWLRAGCAGVVVLRPDTAWRLLPALPGRPYPPGRFLAEDVSHAIDLVRMTDGHMASDRILLSREGASHG